MSIKNSQIGIVWNAFINNELDKVRILLVFFNVPADSGVRISNFTIKLNQLWRQSHLNIFACLRASQNNSNVVLVMHFYKF